MGPYSRFIKLTAAIIAGLLPFLVLPGFAGAAPFNTKNIVIDTGAGRITASPVQTITIPYEFEVIDYSEAEHLPIPDLGMGTVSFINQAGSVALTVLSLFDNYAVLGIFVLILASVAVLFWLWSVVSGRSSNVKLNVSGAVQAGADIYEMGLDQEEADLDDYAGRYNPPDPAVKYLRNDLRNRRQGVRDFRKAARSVKRFR